MLKGAQDIGRVAGGGNREEDVTRLAEGFNLARKETLEAIVIGDGGEDRSVRSESDGTHGGTIVDKAADELRGNVLGIGSAAPVAGHHELAAGQQCAGRGIGSCDERRVQRGVVGHGFHYAEALEKFRAHHIGR